MEPGTGNDPGNTRRHLPSGRLRPQHLSRIALALWIVLGFITWNVVFDYGIRVAAQRYLWQEYQQRIGGRPGLRIDEVMRPAARESAVRATIVGGGIAIAGIVLVQVAARRVRVAGEDGDSPPV